MWRHVSQDRLSYAVITKKPNTSAARKNISCSCCIPVMHRLGALLSLTLTERRRWTDSTAWTLAVVLAELRGDGKLCSALICASAQLYSHFTGQGEPLGHIQIFKGLGECNLWASPKVEWNPKLIQVPRSSRRYKMCKEIMSKGMPTVALSVQRSLCQGNNLWLNFLNKWYIGRWVKE
jgi:hypothetical protein